MFQKKYFGFVVLLGCLPLPSLRATEDFNAKIQKKTQQENAIFQEKISQALQAPLVQFVFSSEKDMERIIAFHHPNPSFEKPVTFYFQHESLMKQIQNFAEKIQEHSETIVREAQKRALPPEFLFLILGREAQNRKNAKQFLQETYVQWVSHLKNPDLKIGKNFWDCPLGPSQLTLKEMGDLVETGFFSQEFFSYLKNDSLKYSFQEKPLFLSLNNFEMEEEISKPYKGILSKAMVDYLQDDIKGMVASAARVHKLSHFFSILGKDWIRPEALLQLWTTWKLSLEQREKMKQNPHEQILSFILNHSLIQNSIEEEKKEPDFWLLAVYPPVFDRIQDILQRRVKNFRPSFSPHYNAKAIDVFLAPEQKN